MNVLRWNVVIRTVFLLFLLVLKYSSLLIQSRLRILCADETFSLLVVYSFLILGEKCLNSLYLKLAEGILVS